MQKALRQPERALWLQLVLGILLYVLCQAVKSVVAAFVLANTEPGRESVTFADGAAAPGPAAIGTLVSLISAVLGFYAIVSFVGKRRPAELAPRGAAAELGIGFGLGAVLVCVAVLVLYLTGVYRPESFGVSPAFWLGVVTFAVGPAVVEELFYRGVLLRVLDNWFGSWVALIIVSVIFAIPHAISPAGPQAAFAVFLTASLVLNAAYLLTRRLWLAIGFHFAFNLFQGSVFGLSVSGYSQSHSLVKASLHGPDIITGGLVGGEGSLVVVLVCFLGGLALLVFTVKRGRFLPRRSREPRTA